ncbi:uncharacterized protein EAE97_008903 [Botrytis byssoidea]|uniref:Uncharacterized protein n=1 Tax=Botrytis byssoidea TaxID=139641 RepID=A0A9P5I8C2_9HELO|nr:uncharacterized protein EAE97_008903 [Botrytis byssoidea]KAF7933136.1 hypothetical protein EAE97_008903 [Botrytis byssoidea]
MSSQSPVAIASNHVRKRTQPSLQNDHESSRGHSHHKHSSNGKHSHGSKRSGQPTSEPQYTYHEVWYCCNCGLNGDGALTAALNAHCTSCGHQRCVYCTTEWIKMRVGT